MLFRSRHRSFLPAEDLCRIDLCFSALLQDHGERAGCAHDADPEPCVLPRCRIRIFGVIWLPDGTVVTGKTGPLLGAAASALMNALKVLAGIPQETDLVSAASIEPIQTLKTNYLGGKNPRLHTDEILIALSSSAASNEQAAAAMHQLPNLKGCDVHSTVLLSGVDTSTLNRLGMYLTCDPVYEEEDRKYHKQ